MFLHNQYSLVKTVNALILISILSLSVTNCLTIHVNNIHNGYKYIVKGTPQ